MNQAESIAALLLFDGADLQDQGWEFLRGLREVSMVALQQEMARQLWPRVCRIQERARIRKISLSHCLTFARRYTALRGVCQEQEQPWSHAEVWVDGGTASRSWPDQSTTVIALQRSSLRVGRSRARTARGGFVRLALPPHHSLRGSDRYGCLWSGGVALSEAEIARRQSRHPAAGLLVSL